MVDFGSAVDGFHVSAAPDQKLVELAGHAERRPHLPETAVAGDVDDVHILLLEGLRTQRTEALQQAVAPEGGGVDQQIAGVVIPLLPVQPERLRDIFPDIGTEPSAVVHAPK